MAGQRPGRAADSDGPAPGQFGFSQIETADQELADIDFFFLDRDCATCHTRQFEELQGSMHSAAHVEPLYRRLAETARAEVGDEIYTMCSGCHSAAGVVTGLIPAKHDPDLPPEAKAGVTCNVCHQISKLTGAEGPWHEPGNASFVIQQGMEMFGRSGEVAENERHTGEGRDFFSKSEFCASCHTVIHPVNGMRIEHTYGEWKSSIYAEKGIQCQDCHMRTVEEALIVAETLRPVVVQGPSVHQGETREIFRHFFVGGNANADRLAGGKMHARMAEQRLKTAARMELESPADAIAGQPVSLGVVVHNVAAGHNLPTGVTELRQMWVELRIVDQDGKVLYRHGGTDAEGELLPETTWYGAVAADTSGKPTHKLWEMASFLRKETIPPKESARMAVSATLPQQTSGPVTIEARLFYRSASPGVVTEIMKEEAFVPTIVEMTSARTTMNVQ